MKRILTSILCLILVLSFTSCAGCGKHPTDPAAKGHDYLDQWSTNATHHWHDCSDKTCTAQIDRAEHTWGEATLVKEATFKEAGELKYVCTVCQRSKIETVDFKGFDASFWADLCKAENFANVTLSENTTVAEVYASAIYYFTTEAVYLTSVNVDTSETTTEEVGEATAARLRSYYADFLATVIALGEKCEYIPISKSLSSSETFDVTVDGGAYKITELKIELDDSLKVSHLQFVMTNDRGATQYDISLSAYGTTKIPEN
jgi:hypothetical protein